MFVKESNNKSGERALTEDQAKQIINSAHTLQDKLLLEVGFNLGLRRDDLVALEVKNIDVNQAQVAYNEKKKGGKIRIVQCPPSLVGEFKRYLATLPKNQQYLFPSREKGTKTGHMSSRTAYKIFNDLCSECNIRVPIPIHSIRASCAKILKNKGWTIEQVARHLGDEVSTVQRYYTIPSDEEMKQLMGKGGVI